MDRPRRCKRRMPIGIAYRLPVLAVMTGGIRISHFTCRLASGDIRILSGSFRVISRPCE